ncbi:ITG-like peptide isoform X1 [Lingula anatina]|uniref:ITG-like peptide isoform X1 n=1 Tax=Lingula anatina TaxID=7574 RepID=A0A1S3ICW3_LINAN|nr:ITG-like peptide isoform X1 [Lingula anatina]|eukprot:XP_013395279.1 ITG-like peptide isoform X1 [Lingula anatina]
MLPTAFHTGILLTVLSCVCAYRAMRFRDELPRVYQYPIQFPETDCSEEGSRCFQTSDCCEGSVCVTDNGLAGTCVPATPRRSGSYLCFTNTDCDPGFECTEVRSQSLRVCKVKGTRKEGEDCEDSSECRPGSCCQDINIFRRGTFRKCGPYYGISKCVRAKSDNSVVFRR